MHKAFVAVTTLVGVLSGPITEEWGRRPNTQATVLDQRSKIKEPQGARRQGLSGRAQW